MARIPDAELVRLKAEVSVARWSRAAGWSCISRVRIIHLPGSPRPLDGLMTTSWANSDSRSIRPSGSRAVGVSREPS